MVASHLLTRYLVSAVLLLFSTFVANARLRDNHHGATYNDDDVHDERASSRVLKENFVGLYLIIINDGERSHDSNTDTPANARPGSAGEDHHHHPTTQTSNIELPDGTIYEVRNAQIGWDTNLTSGRDEIVIPAGSVISSEDGDINVMGQKLSKVVCRSNERKKKKKKSGGFFHRRQLLQDDEEDNDVDDDDYYLEHQHSSSSSNSRRNLQTGTRSVLAVRVLLNDVSYNIASQTGLSNDIFGNGLDIVHLKSQYAACSYNQLLFTKSRNHNMTSNLRGEG